MERLGCKQSTKLVLAIMQKKISCVYFYFSHVKLHLRNLLDHSSEIYSNTVNELLIIPKLNLTSKNYVKKM
jgi:hypothetical protein